MLPRNTRRCGLVVGLIALASGCAQTLVPPEEAAKFGIPIAREPLTCRVDPLRPIFDFSFRFQAGYRVRVGLDQYHTGNHEWLILTRIEPNGQGKPVFLVDRRKFSTAGPENMAGETGGEFWLGEGGYHAYVVLMDEQHRVCRADWSVDVKLESKGVKPLIAPGTVQEISARTLGGNRETARRIGHLTVLLHAAPASPRLAKIPAEDEVMLLGALGSLLESVPAQWVKLVVFSLEQQKEIYRQDDFHLEQLPEVHQAIFDLQLGSVDFHQLENPAGPSDFLKRLVAEELAAKARADEVVFLGPRSRVTTNPKLAISKQGAPTPEFFYLQYVPQPRLELPRSTQRAGANDEFSRMGSPALTHGRETRTNHDEGGNGIYVIPDPAVVDSLSTPKFRTQRDAIDYAVGSLKGQTFLVSTPSDFAKAIHEHVAK